MSVYTSPLSGVSRNPAAVTPPQFQNVFVVFVASQRNPPPVRPRQPGADFLSLDVAVLRVTQTQSRPCRLGVWLPSVRTKRVSFSKVAYDTRERLPAAREGLRPPPPRRSAKPAEAAALAFWVFLSRHLAATAMTRAPTSPWPLSPVCRRGLGGSGGVELFPGPDRTSLTLKPSGPRGDFQPLQPGTRKGVGENTQERGASATIPVPRATASPSERIRQNWREHS